MAARCLSLDLMARVEEADKVNGALFASWKSCFEQRSTKMALWSLLVTQLNGAYPMDLIIRMITGEQYTASIRWVPRL